MDFNRDALLESLATVPAVARSCLALAATQRIANLYDAWAGAPSPGIATAWCDRFWKVLSDEPSNLTALEIDPDEIALLYPREEYESDPLTVAVADLPTCLLHTWNSMRQDDLTSSALALERTYDTAFQVSLNLVADYENTGDGIPELNEAYAAAIRHPILIRELAAQVGDLDDAFKQSSIVDLSRLLAERSRRSPILTNSNIEQVMSRG